MSDSRLPHRPTHPCRGLARFAAVPAMSLLVASLTTLAASAYSAPAPWVVIDNGVVQLGVNDVGDLNVPADIDSAGGTPNVGLRLLATNNEATAGAEPCEGWGVADAITEVTGYADEALGRSTNLSLVSFATTGRSAVSTVRVGDTFEVTHDYHPSPATPQLYEVTVTIKNISHATVEPRYRRVMDWDIEPTAFAEYSTIQGTAHAADVLFASDDGFASPDPLTGPSSIDFVGDAVDNGPDDHGALFDFGFPDLPRGASLSFQTYYGGAPTEAAALSAIGATGAEVFSLGQPSTKDGPTLGTPNTFVFAFAGVGGHPQVPQVSLTAPTATVTENAGQLTVPVTLNGPAVSPVTVHATTSNGSATAGADYIAVDTHVTIPVGHTRGSVSIPVVDDRTDEPDETLTLRLSEPVNAVLGDPRSVTITIADDDPPAPTNHPPLARDQAVTTGQETPVTITLRADDADRDQLTYTVVDGPRHGTLTGTATSATRTYTPAPGYSGPDTFTFRANDGHADSNVATVSLTITPTPAPYALSGHGRIYAGHHHGRAGYKFDFHAERSSTGTLSGLAGVRTPRGWFRGQQVTSLAVTGDSAVVVYQGTFRSRYGYTLTVRATDARTDRITLVVTRGSTVVSWLNGNVHNGNITIP
ncbi:Calx-beta domain-containing protein [Nocardioides sp.]|uniref:Calx-beta domain-containing protein n=1 Tax=Nocardioides sp. TaxID=35761 RepID=UPI0025D523DB|nr:Calx-beta domain-containing protein [Nocardioides sp.]